MANRAQIGKNRCHVEPQVEDMIGVPEEQHGPGPIVKSDVRQGIIGMDVQDHCIEFRRPETNLGRRLQPG